MNSLLPLAQATIYWHLPFLILIISLVYSATRHENWDAIWREAVRWGLRMTTFLVVIGAIIFVLATFMG